MMSRLDIKADIQHRLDRAQIALNGSNPWDIQVHDPRFYQRVMADGSLGLGESYMDGWWDSQQLDEFFCRICRTGIDQQFERTRYSFWLWLHAVVLNLQSKKRSFIVGKEHYDLGNDLFERMLDRRMTYSCAYWKHAGNLDDAQEAKLDLICKKIGLQPKMKVLDIGCGWGSFAKFAAEHYQAHVTGITVSKEQLELAQRLCQGLPVDLHLLDYRDVSGKFDRIVSVGQMEHVGYKNYGDYFRIVHQCLEDDGLFLLHTIGNNRSYSYGDPWIQKYIFPNGMLPSIKQLSAACEGLFIMEDWHNFGIYYDKTLMAWHRNFVTHWKEIESHYGDRFYRMWNYYLLSCAGTFRARAIQLWQIVFSKKGVIGGYTSIR